MPDGSEAPIHDYKDLLITVTEWLVEHDKLTHAQLPVSGIHRWSPVVVKALPAVESGRKQWWKAGSVYVGVSRVPATNVSQLCAIVESTGQNRQTSECCFNSLAE